MVKKLYSYKLESHPNVKLIDHLRYVGDRCASLLMDKDIKFTYTRNELMFIAKVMGYCHDLGKGTIYFQKYLKKEKVKESLKSHAHLSALICYLNLKDINLELAIMAYIAVLRHHGNIKNFKDYTIIEGNQITILNEQYKALDEEIKVVCKELDLKLPLWKELEEVLDDLEDALDDYNEDLNDNESFEKYILIKLLFSLLIHADKEHAIFREEKNIIYNLPNTLIDDYKLKKFGEPTTYDIRDIVYDDVINSVNSCEDRIMSITLPTGSGKTYACMSAALRLKNKINKDMKIVYCLPFTSVIDQNFNDYVNAIKTIKNVSEVSSNDILKHHYLSPNEYKNENLYYENDEGRFLIHNWNSQIVVTTFIQLFNTLFSNSNSNLIKFNTLSNSIILLDEVQSIPYKYWKIINLFFKELSELLNIYFIFITATQPLIFNKNEIKELASKSDLYFKQCKRTRLIIHDKPMEKDIFFDFIKESITNNDNKNILIIVNTIKLSQELYDFIKDEKYSREVIYLSTSIIPKARLERINKIKEPLNKKIVISTQMVEAGVDIDMDIVIRDIAPLDSINQSAGRSNRENRGIYLGEVHLVKVKSNGKLLAKYVYKDDILLQGTEKVLKDKDIILEEDYKEISDSYFKEIDKNKGNVESNKLLDSILTLEFQIVDKNFKLIEDQDKVQIFVEVNEEAALVWNQFKEFQRIEDVFDRRNKLQGIKGDFYQYVISVFKNKCKENIEYGIGYISKEQLENSYDIEKGYKLKEDAALIF